MQSIEYGQFQLSDDVYARQHHFVHEHPDMIIEQECLQMKEIDGRQWINIPPPESERKMRIEDENWV